MHAFGNMGFVVGFVHLILKPFVKVNLIRFQAYGHQVSNAFGNDGRRRNHPRISADIQFDAHNIVRRNESAPRIANVFIAGQLCHSSCHHLTDDFGVDVIAAGVQAPGRFD
jgi:hypothetical protein